jgi:quercetin dioxygenase-like cupin family protein
MTGQDIVAEKPGEIATPSAFRHQVMNLQDFMQAMPEKLDIEKDCPVRHIFAPGAYAREMTIPKGTVIIGKIHRHAHLNFISAGKVRVVTEDGSHELTAPHTFVSTVGTKRVVYALEDTIWTTVHITTETDLEKIEEQVIAKSYDELSAPALEEGKP